jgi:hypothetical protein
MASGVLADQRAPLIRHPDSQAADGLCHASASGLLVRDDYQPGRGQGIVIHGPPKTPDQSSSLGFCFVSIAKKQAAEAISRRIER